MAGKMNMDVSVDRESLILYAGCVHVAHRDAKEVANQQIFPTINYVSDDANLSGGDAELIKTNMTQVGVMCNNVIGKYGTAAKAADALNGHLSSINQHATKQFSQIESEMQASLAKLKAAGGKK